MKSQSHGADSPLTAFVEASADLRLQPVLRGASVTTGPVRPGLEIGKTIRGVSGLRLNPFTPALEARRLFNPHRARSGSVQRILSAMLRHGARSFLEDLSPEHCG